MKDRRSGCKVDGCTERHKGLGYCHKHLQRVKKSGGALLPDPLTLEQRFWQHVTKDDSGCWLWTAGTTTFGYGLVREFGRNGRVHGAHRLSWEIHHGAIAEGLHVCHKCDVPACVNPSHLFLGTARDNVRDMHAKGRAVSTPLPGEQNPAAKLTEGQVREIRQRLSSGESPASIAQDYPVGRTSIDNIKQGVTWTHVAD